LQLEELEEAGPAVGDEEASGVLIPLEEAMAGGGEAASVGVPRLGGEGVRWSSEAAAASGWSGAAAAAGSRGVEGRMKRSRVSSTAGWFYTLA
jgi:hypothetical protein